MGSSLDTNNGFFSFSVQPEKIKTTKENIKYLTIIRFEDFLNISINKNTNAPISASSERRGSNSRHPPWQGGALPAELLSQIRAEIKLLFPLGQSDLGKNSYLGDALFMMQSPIKKKMVFSNNF